jgi:hypothetical protein
MQRGISRARAARAPAQQLQAVRRVPRPPAARGNQADPQGRPARLRRRLTRQLRRQRRSHRPSRLNQAHLNPPRRAHNPPLPPSTGCRRRRAARLPQLRNPRPLRRQLLKRPRPHHRQVRKPANLRCRRAAASLDACGRRYSISLEGCPINMSLRATSVCSKARY